jgi:hypothetical protein
MSETTEVQTVREPITSDDEHLRRYAETMLAKATDGDGRNIAHFLLAALDGIALLGEDRARLDALEEMVRENEVSIDTRESGGVELRRWVRRYVSFNWSAGDSVRQAIDSWRNA